MLLYSIVLRVCVNVDGWSSILTVLRFAVTLAANVLLLVLLMLLVPKLGLAVKQWLRQGWWRWW